MHRNNIFAVLFIFHAAFIFGKAASILDLFSWDVRDKSEVMKKDDEADTTVQHSCACDGGPSCMCCVDFNITYIDFGGPGCVRMKYISQEEGIAVNVSYGESLLHSQQMKGPNPEPACASIMANFAHVCARFSDLHPVEDGLKGCLHLEPKLFGQVQAQFDLGCFVIGSDGMKINSNSNSTAIPLVNEHENETKHEGQSESEEVNEEELIAAVNETAEQGLVFFGNWLGLFGKPDVNETNSETASETNSATESFPVSTETSREVRVLPTSARNDI